MFQISRFSPFSPALPALLVALSAGGCAPSQNTSSELKRSPEASTQRRTAGPLEAATAAPPSSPQRLSALEAYGPVDGFVDTHNHQFAEFAYGGAWFYGSTFGAEGGDETGEGLAACDGNRPDGPQDHAMTYLNVLCRLAGWYTDDMCLHTEATNGYVEDPSQRYTGWPHSTSYAHHQTWGGHLKQAHEDGLNISVVSMVNFKLLCDIMEPDNYRYFYDCEDMGAVDLELEMAWEFARQNADWMEIALTPEDARRIIHEGKLAVVLAVEITDIFATGEMDYAPMEYDAAGNIISRGGVYTQLQRYYDMGVRSIQLAHELDDRFAGVALYSPVFILVEALRKIQEHNETRLPGLKLPGDGDPQRLWQLDQVGYNRLGLTDEGEELTRALMDLGMILDIAHLSHKSQEGMYQLAKENNYYPLFHSHAKAADIMTLPGEPVLEKYTNDTIASYIRVTGGFLGMRTFSDLVNSWPESGVTNSCDGSSRSLSQAYAYMDQEWQIPLGFAVDFNGFTTQTDPRFGDNACSKAPTEEIRLEQAGLQSGPTDTQFDQYGLGHMGVLGRGLLNDMKTVGADTSNLESGAESFIQMWERSVDPNRSGPASAPPVADWSQLKKGSTADGGLIIESLRTGNLATEDAYAIYTSGTGTTRTAQLKRLSDGQVLGSVTYDETERVSNVTWRTFEFGEYLTFKIGSNADGGSDLSTLDTSFFEGNQSVTLAYP